MKATVHGGERALVESVPDGIVTVDRGGRIGFANAAITRMFGYTADELAGQSVEILVPEGQRAGHASARALFQRAPRVREMGASRELAGRRKDGSTFPVEIMLSPLSGDDPAGAIAIIRDVTSRRETEQELRLWRRAVDQAQIAIAIVDGGRRTVLAANPAFAAMHGYELAEVIGQPADAMGDVQLRLAALAPIHAAGHDVFWSTRVRKDGSVFSGLVDVTLIPADGGTVDAIVLVQDLTETLREQADRERQLGEAFTALAAREELVAIASHDVRSPLSGIRLQLQNIAQRADKAEGVLPKAWLQERLGTINETLDHVLGLLESLLERHRRESPTPGRESIRISCRSCSNTGLATLATATALAFGSRAGS